MLFLFPSVRAHACMHTHTHTHAFNSTSSDMVSLLASFFGRVAVMPIQVPVAMLLTRPISTSPIIETGAKKPRWTGPPFPKRPSASFMLYYRKQFNELEAEEPSKTSPKSPVKPEFSYVHTFIQLLGSIYIYSTCINFDLSIIAKFF